jgi:hypothetical protein
LQHPPDGPVEPVGFHRRQGGDLAVWTDPSGVKDFVCPEVPNAGDARLIGEQTANVAAADQ